MNDEELITVEEWARRRKAPSTDRPKSEPKGLIRKLPKPITPTRKICSVMPHESLEARLLREARERASEIIAEAAADRLRERLLQEGREKLNEPARTMADKINQILKNHDAKPYGLAKSMELSGDGSKKVYRYLSGKTKTPPGSPAAIARALSELCNSPITEKDINDPSR